MEPFIHDYIISNWHKVMETANSQRQAIKPAYFIIWLSIEDNGKHGLNIGRDKYSVLAIRLQVQRMNRNLGYKHCQHAYV